MRCTKGFCCENIADFFWVIFREVAKGTSPQTGRSPSRRRPESLEEGVKARITLWIRIYSGWNFEDPF